ncbi:sporulation peptidase YabG [Bacillota bacterium LX-D]|nr:sporulation peptidase YabG [Bacillota bacterium LX-D]
MPVIKPGDIVTRKSYGGDIYFRIIDVQKGVCTIKGLDVRLIADAPISDLEVKKPNEILQYKQRKIQINIANIKKIKSKRNEEIPESRGEKLTGNFFDFPGKVLHIDGDNDYLQKCMEYYRQLNIPAQGFYVAESEQPKVVQKLLRDYKPDILILTGHDALFKGAKDLSSLNSYRNSKYYVASVKKAREINNGLDDLVIFAGACQSNYEKLLQAGANFASSPQRVLINVLDPVFIAEKVAFTSIEKTIGVKEVVQQTITGEKGVGGVQTRGRYRLGYPRTVL